MGLAKNLMSSLLARTLPVHMTMVWYAGDWKTVRSGYIRVPLRQHFMVLTALIIF